MINAYNNYLIWQNILVLGSLQMDFFYDRIIIGKRKHFIFFDVITIILIFIRS